MHQQMLGVQGESEHCKKGGNRCGVILLMNEQR
jgi:hypothetical protein